MIKVIVAGSRTFSDFNVVEKQLMMYFKANNLHRQDVEIISGTANGADKLGEKFAEKYNLKLTKFPADWDKYGKSAGYIRNEEMAKYAIDNGIVFVFWDGESKGTKHMISMANKYNIETKIFINKD